MWKDDGPTTEASHTISSPGAFASGELKISIVIKNVIWFEVTLMHTAEGPSNHFFTYNQAERIKKGVICVQILLEIHLTEHGRFHFQGRTTFYAPVLVTSSRHMTSHRRQSDDISMSCTCRVLI